MTVRHPLTGLLSALLVTSASAAIWESGGWALSSEVNGSIGYDSNLTLVKGGDGALYMSGTPSLTLFRPNSATQLEAKLSLSDTHFFSYSESNQFDGGIALKYAYPVGEGVGAPKYQASASYNSQTTANSSVGQRIKSDVYRFQSSMTVLQTGKLAGRVRVEGASTDYKEKDLNLNQFGGLSLGVGYQSSPKLEYSTNLRLGWSRSKPHDSLFASTKNFQKGLTVNVEGDLSSKITGTAYVGIEHDKLSGAFSRSDVLPIVGASVTWQATPTQSVQASAELSSNFSPDGYQENHSMVQLEYKREIYGRWFATATVGGFISEYKGVESIRTDKEIQLGAGLRYVSSERLDCGVDAEWHHQTSDTALFAFSREIIVFDVRMHF